MDIDLDDIFRYHPPTADQIPKYEAIRSEAKEFAKVVIENTPLSADRSSAVRKIREAVMTANAAIALNGKA